MTATTNTMPNLVKGSRLQYHNELSMFNNSILVVTRVGKKVITLKLEQSSIMDFCREGNNTIEDMNEMFEYGRLTLA